MNDVREVLSALIDREPVDPDILAQVLEDPANRALLVDFGRLRGDVLADGPGERAWRPDARAVRATSGAFGTGRSGVGRSRGSGWLRAAAVFLLLAAGAGGGAWLERYASAERPPEPDRIVRLEPVPTPGTVQVIQEQTRRER